jgi:thymidylate kinase
LFKGGLFVRYYQLARDKDLRQIIKTHPRYLYPSRAFFCTEDASQRSCLGHVGTGFMADSGASESGSNSDFSTFLIEFITTILEKEKQRCSASARPRGAFAVLIGLDGSGKTTLARNLCRLASAGTRFDGVCYFHWRPKFLQRSEFPLPEFSEVLRKGPMRKTWINALLSCLRLAKNVLLANLAYRLRVRRLAQHNHLVLIDRYFYNYELDPDSVKYAGPRWFLDLLLPLFPKPDVVITLNAGAETLLARKRELSPEQIARQISIKDSLDFQGTTCIAVDAAQPALRVAEQALAALVTRSSEEVHSSPAYPGATQP